MLPPLPIPPIAGAEAVVAWFGLWPSFHDAETLSLETNRRATSLIRLHAWTRRAILAFFVFLGAGLGVAACDSLPLSDPLNPTPLQPRIAEITITGPTSVSVSGLPVQFKATAVFSGGATQDVTASAMWSSANDSIATLAAGAVVGVGPGQVEIRAKHQNITGRVLVRVAGD